MTHNTYVYQYPSPLQLCSNRDARVLAVLRSLFFVCLFDQDDFRFVNSRASAILKGYLA